MTEGKNELPKLEDGLENEFKIVLTPEEVRKIQEERKPLTPEQIAEIQVKIKGVVKKAKSDIQEIMVPAIQADAVLSKITVLEPIPQEDHILYIVEIETENGKKILHRKWYFGPSATGEFVTEEIKDKITPPVQ